MNSLMGNPIDVRLMRGVSWAGGCYYNSMGHSRMWWVGMVWASPIYVVSLFACSAKPSSLVVLVLNPIMQQNNRTNHPQRPV